MTVSRTSSFLAGIILVGVAAAFWVPESIGGPDVCQPGYARSMRLSAARYYPVAEEAYRRAGIPWSERRNHVLDHVRPICLGGTWDQANLQVQTKADAARKDKVEWRACRAYCRGEIGMDQARRMVSEWRK